MFDRDQFKEEIFAQLNSLPRDKQVAFAVRSAMRVLPLLAVPHKKTSKLKTWVQAMTGQTDQSRVAFGFWPIEKRQQHLLAVLRAYSVCMGWEAKKNLGDGNFRPAANPANP
ncbi:MAG: hypothetical protein HOP34_00130, partial [Methylococcaceae bacterium]|nr:hypothetical protein [Methylococcaceae bacterium]